MVIVMPTTRHMMTAMAGMMMYLKAKTIDFNPSRNEPMAADAVSILACGALNDFGSLTTVASAS